MARESALATIFENLKTNVVRHAAPGPVTVALDVCDRTSFDLSIVNMAPERKSGDGYGLGMSTIRDIALSLGFKLRGGQAAGRFTARITGRCRAGGEDDPDSRKT